MVRRYGSLKQELQKVELQKSDSEEKNIQPALVPDGGLPPVRLLMAGQGICLHP